MALTISGIASATNASQVTSQNISGITALAGNMLVIAVALENTGAAGAAPTCTLSDTEGNTYTQRALVNNSGGTACCIYIFTSILAFNKASGTITIAIGNASRVAADVNKVTGGAGETPAFVSGDNTGSTGSGSAIAYTTPSVTDTFTVFCASAWHTNDTATGDSDTTNGNWSTIRSVTAPGITDSTAIKSCTQYKTVTSTATQTWNVSIPGSFQYAASSIILKVATSTSVTADPGTYAVSGSTATLKHGYHADALSSSYLLSGNAANFSFLSGLGVSADQGAYELVGSASALLKYGYKAAAAGSSYALTGSSANLNVSTGTRILAAQGGSYSLTGASADFGYVRVGRPGRASTSVRSIRASGSIHSSVRVSIRAGVSRH